MYAIVNTELHNIHIKILRGTIHHTHHEIVSGGGRGSVTGELRVEFKGLARLHVDVLHLIVSHNFTAVNYCVMGRPMHFSLLHTNSLYLNPEVRWIGWYSLGVWMCVDGDSVYVPYSPM